MNTSPIRAALIAVLLLVPLTSAASGRLDVIIRSGGGVTSGWLAVVRADAPYSEPSFEQRVTAGRRFAADLPEGRYYAGLATVGGELDARPITIVAGQTTSAEWTLRGAPSQRGRVYDEQGAPIADATVAQLRSVLHPWVGFFSAEALQALTSGWSATTDEEGAWALPVSSRERIPCIVSKQGRTPVILNLTESSPPPDVVLQQGRELRLAFDRPEAGAVLHLEPLDPERLQPELARWMERYSTRTETKVVHWDALPPARYRVIEEHRAAPGSRRELLTVDLTAESAEIAPDRAGTIPGAARIHAAFVEKRVVADDRPRLFVEGVEREHRLRATPGGTRVEWAGSSAATPVHLTTHAHIFIAADQGGDVRRLETFARADMRARLLLPPGGAPVEQLDVSFSQCSGGRRPVYRLQPASSRIELAVPSACGALYLTPTPYRLHTIPYRLVSGAQRDLGELRLVSGTTLVVQTVAVDPNAPLPGRVITIRSKDDSSDIVGQATTGADGAARLTGLPLQEPLVLEAVEPITNSRGRADLLLGVTEQAAVRVALLPPATVRLNVRLSPSFRTIDPKAVIEEVTLLSSLASERPLHAPVTGSEARVDRVPAGLWVATALVRTGDHAVYPIRAGELKIEPSQNIERELEVEPLVFHGRVLRRNEPVSGDLSLADAKQPGAIRRTVRVGPDGSFSVLLPSAGLYDVDVRPAGEAKIRLGWSRFDDPAHPLAISIPSGAIRCVALSASGERQAGTAIVLEQVVPGAPPTVRGGRTGATGEVVIGSLAPGEWIVTVQGADAAGERVTLRGEEEALVVLRVP